MMISGAVRGARRAVLALLIGTTCATTVLPPGNAFAQAPKPDKAALDEAKDRFKRGMQLYGEGSLDAALVELQRAYSIAPNYKILYNVAVVYRDQRNYVESLKYFEKFLEDGGKAVDAAKRKEADREIEQLRKFVAKVDIKTNVEGAEVRIDDAPVGTTPLAGPIAVNAGKRRVSATAPGRVEASEVVTIGGGDSVKVDLQLAEPAKPPPPPPEPPPPPPPPPPSKFTTLSYVGLGAAGALAIGATITGLMSLGASSDLEEKRFVGANPNSDATDQQSKVQTLALTTDILAGAAIVTLGVTLFLTLTRHPVAETPAPAARTTKLTVTPSIMPGGAAIVGRF